MFPGRHAALIQVSISLGPILAVHCSRQVSKRYYNAHALVDVTIALEFKPPLMDGKFAEGVHPLVQDPKIVVSVPTIIHKAGACFVFSAPS